LANTKLATADSPAILAVTVYWPALLLAVNVGAVATPCPFVLAVAVFTPEANVPLAPLVGAVNVTSTPFTAFPPASVTNTCNGAKLELMTTLCGVPPAAAILVGKPDWFVSAKFAGFKTPATVAVTVYAPAVLLAVNTGAVATPCPFVLTVAVVPTPVNVPLAPLVGAVNVTTAPPSG
jgi:hypothetical protein